MNEQEKMLFNQCSQFIFEMIQKYGDTVTHKEVINITPKSKSLKPKQ